MKTLKYIIIAIFVAIAGLTIHAQIPAGSTQKTLTNDSIKVSGNCGMCKSRIEQAAKITGVTTAVWDVKSKMLKISYNATQTNLDAVGKAVALAGHDNAKGKAAIATYKALPGCCKYER